MTEIMIPQTFEEKMKDRIRESIGELITDKELTELVRKSIDRVFFTPTEIGDTYHRKAGPSLLNGLIRELLTPQVNEAVQEYIKDHPDEVSKVIKEVLSMGMGNALVTAISSQFQGALFNLQSNIETTILNR